MWNRNSINRAWHSERNIRLFLCRNSLTLIGTDNIIKIKPDMQWALMKPVWRDQLIHQRLLAYLIIANYSLIILKRIYSFASVKTHQLVKTMLLLMYCRRTTIQNFVTNNNCMMHIYAKYRWNHEFIITMNDKIKLHIFFKDSFVLSEYIIPCLKQRTSIVQLQSLFFFLGFIIPDAQASCKIKNLIFHNKTL